MRRWFTWWDDADGSSLGRLDLKPGQEIWDSSGKVDRDGLLEINVLVEDNGQPLVFEQWEDVRRTETDIVGRLESRRELSTDEAIPCKYYQLPPRNCSDPKRWVEYACLD